ncbi:MAG: RNA 3'-terminal phosphate cyclase, partial [Nanoarchaeota archaeon]
YLHRFVDKIELKILKRGYYPKGQGQIKLEVSPRFKLHEYDSFSALRDELPFKVGKIILLEQGKLEQIRGIVNSSQELQEKEVGERISNSALASLKQYDVPINIRVEYAKAESIGGEVLLWGLFSRGGEMDYDNPVLLAGDALIEPQKRSEDIGKEAAEELKAQIEAKAAVDNHLADQLIQFMGLLPGSKIKAAEISSHAQTNMYVVEKFLPVGFKVDKSIVSVEER